MTKMEFVLLLHEKLPAVPKDEVEERLSFYVEMIEDRMEEGLSEEEAVAAVGSVEQIAAQILEEIPLGVIVKEKLRTKKQPKGWRVALLVLGVPVWLPLLIAAVAVTLSLYISLWAVAISLWAVFASLIAVGISGIAAGVGFMISGEGLSGAAMIGAGILCLGLGIFLFFGCKEASKGLCRLGGKTRNAIKGWFLGNKEADKV